MRVVLLTVASLVMSAGGVLAEDADAVVSLLEFVIDVDDETAAKCLRTLTERVQSGEVTGEQLVSIRKQLGPTVAPLFETGSKSALRLEAALLAASWDDPEAKRAVRMIALSAKESVERRKAAIDALASSQDGELLKSSKQMLAANDTIVASFLGAIGRYESASVAQITLAAYDDLSDELQPRAIDLLTQRTAWSEQLLAAIGRGQVAASSLNVNQIRKLLASRDKRLAAMARQHWGQVRTQRDPRRELVMRKIRETLGASTGDPHQGQKVFNRVCGQCHKIYGIGQDVGPEITRNGRGNFEQLLSNVFDPSLVIGAAYQARTVVTTDGRVLTGLLSEDNEQRIVLMTQGGKQEIIPRDKVDEVVVSKLSLMPEGLEKQLPAKEIVDLLAFLVLTKPPADAEGEVISGTPANLVGR